MFARFMLGLMLGVVLVAAQEPGGADEGMAGGRGGMRGSRGQSDMGGGMRPAQRQSKAELLASRLKLSGDQKSQLQDILSAAREEATPLQQQLLRGRANIANAALNGKSEAELKPLLDDYSALASQMGNVEARAFSKFNAMLKPNQQSKAGQAFELLAGIIETPGRPAGRKNQ